MKRYSLVVQDRNRDRGLPSMTVSAVVSRRDSATAKLRKLGMAPQDYDDFIKPSADGKGFIVLMDAAKAFLDPTKPKPKKKKVVDPNAPVVPTINIAAKVRELIKQGLDNATIAAQLDLPPKKRHYPAWYRAEMKRKER